MSLSDATIEEVDQAVACADACFQPFRKSSGDHRANFLRQIKEELKGEKETILGIADHETALGKKRLSMEFERTLGEIENFSKLCKEHDLFQANLDPTDSRGKEHIQMIPLGPVAVIGACNFPLAISVVGTDTISAFVAGCPVIVKSHPGHPQTCQVLADAVYRAIAHSDMPPHCFQLLHGQKKEVTQHLVRHPGISAIAFTGSLTGGSALHAINQERTEPVPFYAEMGSLNPVFALPHAVESGGRELAKDYVQAVNLFAGQMCTKPGALFILQSSITEDFLKALHEAIQGQATLRMLNAEIHGTYEASCLRLERQIELFCSSSKETKKEKGRIKIFKMEGNTFLQNKSLRAEAFGPCSMLVSVKDENQFLEIAESLDGSLTTSLHGTRKDHRLAERIFPILESKTGRLLYNGFPPGVVPGIATHHGGPWPGTTDSRFTSIGKQGYQRFLRPLIRQN